MYDGSSMTVTHFQRWGLPSTLPSVIVRLQRI